MIICNLQGGFGNHMLCTFLAVILHHYSKKKIKIVSNEISGDSNEQRNDTRTAIHKLFDSSILTTHSNCTHTLQINTPESYHNVYKSIKDNNNLYNDYNIHINLIHISDMEFYYNHIDIIKKYVHINKPNIDMADSVVLSLRLGMGATEVANPSPYANHLKLPLNYYKDILDKIDTKSNIYVCSDNYTDKYITDLANNYKNVILLNEYKTYEQFCILCSAPIFISSNSTFSIIATLFNNNEVYFPRYISSGTVFPGDIHKRYSIILNNTASNIINVDIK